MKTSQSRCTLEPLQVETADGLSLTVHRLRGRAGQRSRTPVMLLHGLSANRMTFTFPGRSLADYLAHHGFDCYVPELRGAGMSDRPASWDLDDYLQLDLPPVLDAIRDDAESESVHWIGHSMGGILLLTYLIEHSDAPVASGLTIGSALDYSGSANAFIHLQHLMPLVMRMGTLPWGTILHWLSPAVGRVTTPVETFNFCTENIEPELIRTVYANAFEPIPARLLRALATTFEHRGLRNRDASIYYLEHTDRIRAPICLIAGSRDVQCPASAVASTAAALTETAAQLTTFGRHHGHRTDYGHFDLILGKYAPGEVWPVAVDWLVAHSPGPD